MDDLIDGLYKFFAPKLELEGWDDKNNFAER